MGGNTGMGWSKVFEQTNNQFFLFKHAYLYVAKVKQRAAATILASKEKRS